MKNTWRSFAIVPAAGHSRRMMEPKLLLPWGDTTVLEQTLSAWRAAAVTNIFVVCRRDDVELIDRARRAGAEVVVPDADPPEMKDSIRVALEHVAATMQPAREDVWLLAPADMPWLSAKVIGQLLAAHNQTAPRIRVPVCNGRRGHPVLFPWSTAAEVERLGAEEGVNALLIRHGWSPLAVEDASILGDLDTPEDYQSHRGGRPEDSSPDA